MTKRRYREHLGAKFSEGSRRLWTILKKDFADDRQALADALGFERSVLFRYLYGDMRPERGPADVMTKKLGIAGSLWDEEPHRAFRIPPFVPLASTRRETVKATGTS